jgi:hypothetical protein
MDTIDAGEPFAKPVNVILIVLLVLFFGMFCFGLARLSSNTNNENSIYKLPEDASWDILSISKDRADQWVLSYTDVKGNIRAVVYNPSNGKIYESAEFVKVEAEKK